MAISLNTFAPNTKAASADINTNFTNLKTGVHDAAYRAFTWGILGTLTVGNAQGMKYLVPQNVTVTGLWAKTDSGTATVRIQKDGVDIHSGYAVTSTAASTTSFAATAVTAGQLLTLDITAASGVAVFVTLDAQVSTIA